MKTFLDEAHYRAQLPSPEAFRQRPGCLLGRSRERFCGTSGKGPRRGLNEVTQAFPEVTGPLTSRDKVWPMGHWWQGP